MAKIKHSLGPYELNQVHVADALSALARLPSNSIDITITSPPYWGQRGQIGLGCEQDPRDYVENLSAIFAELLRVLKPSGLLWLNIGDSYNTPINWKFEHYVHSTLGKDRMGLGPNNKGYTKDRGSRRAFIRKDVPWLQYGNLLALPYRIILKLCDEGFLFRGEVIWAKRKAMPEGRCRRPHRKHEPIYILAKTEKHAFRTTPPVSSVWDIKHDFNTTPHTSPFPLDLPTQCIRASGIGSGIVLDPFMGSGTTAIAAQLLGFDYIGFDVNPDNVSIAKERIAQTKSKKRTRGTTATSISENDPTLTLFPELADRS